MQVNYTFLDTAKERSKKFHLIKYKILLSKLVSLDEGGFFENTTQNYLVFLSKLKSSDLITNATDFFWSLIHRLTSALDKNNKEEIEKTYIYFLLNAFDSFYLLLPLNSKVQFKGIGSRDIVLPKLGISLNYSPTLSATLFKVSNTDLNYELNAFDDTARNNYVITLNEIPLFFRLKKEITCGRIAIIYQKSENIFEEPYCQYCCDNVLLCHLFKNKIEKGFDKIQATDGTLYDKLVSSIDYIIPMEKGYPNFATTELKKTIFLSIDLLDEPDIYVAEYIIHEYSHCELHYVQDTVLLTNIKNNILEYYSPWRTDPRPLLGLIHAIFVSNEVLCFYFTYLLNKNIYPDETKLVNKKIELLIHRIIIGIKQIKKQHITNFTLELVKIITEVTQEVSEHLTISTSTLPEEITNHMEIWKSKNLNFAVVE